MVTTTTRYKSSSPYSRTAYLEGKFLDILSYKPLPAQADDIYKQIGATYQYRPDLMSFDLYGTVDYWYVFTLRNRDILIDPIWDFTADKKIYIPKLNTLLANLGS